MSGGSGPDTRWPPPWKPPASARRTPVPSYAAVSAAPLLQDLFAALGDDPAPCAVAPAIWTSEHPDDVLVAQQGCTDCPARKPCAAYALASGATAGTWAGQDMTPRSGHHRPTTTEGKIA